MALAKELGIHAIVDRVTHTIVHNNRATELSGRSGGGDDCCRRVVRGRRRRAGLEETLALSITNNTEFGAHDDDDDNRYRPPSASSSPARQQQKQRTQLSSSTPHCWSAGAARPVPSPVCPAPNRSSPTRNERPPKEDVERLRRVVRTTMLSLQTPPSSTSLYGGIASGGGLERGESRAFFRVSFFVYFFVVDLSDIVTPLQSTGGRVSYRVASVKIVSRTQGLFTSPW